MSKSEVLPEGWEVATLSELADIRSGGTPSTSDASLWDGDIAWVTPTDITALGGRKFLRSTARTISRAGLRQSSAELLPEGTIVMTSRATIGECAIATIPLTTNQGFKNFIPKDRADRDFLYYLLMSQKRGFIELCSGSTFLEIGKTQLTGYTVRVPETKDEQQAIAAALSDADGVVAGLERVIAKKRLIKQGAMQDLLTARRRLPGFSGEWESFLISDLERRGSVRLGRGQVISKVDIEDIPGQFPIYSSSALNNGLFGMFGKHDFDEELITWSIDGGGYFFHRPRHKFSITNVCGFLRVVDGSLSYRFLVEALKSARMRMKFDYQDKAHPSVVRNAYTVPIPSLTEQIAIASVAADMDAEIQTLESRLAKARAVKEGMMQNLLTGRVRLV